MTEKDKQDIAEALDYLKNALNNERIDDIPIDIKSVRKCEYCILNDAYPHGVPKIQDIMDLCEEYTGDPFAAYMRGRADAIKECKEQCNGSFKCELGGFLVDMGKDGE